MGTYIIFTNPRVHNEMIQISIVADKVDVRDGWLCLWTEESIVASFDITTIYGWLLCDARQQTKAIRTTDATTEPLTEQLQTDSEVARNSLRTDCTGCKFVGWYDTDFPCVNCVRKNKDYYTAEQTERSSDDGA